MQPQPPPNARRGVQSIDVGLTILQALTEADGDLTLTAVAKASGVPSSSCHRYLASFIKAGFVTQHPASGRYDLGPQIIQAGLVALRRADPIVVGLQTCEALAQATQRTAQLAIWSADGPVIVSWRMGRVPVPTNLAVGSRLPVLRSATGKAFLAYLPPGYWEHLIEREGASPGQALAMAGQVRQAGYATAAGEVIPGLSAVAAPLLDARGEPAAVIALLGLEGQIRDSDIDHLLTGSRSASARLGAAPAHVV